MTGSVQLLRTCTLLKASEAEGRRTIKGWASTPTADRMGDVIDPQGVKYQLPFPLLLAHDHTRPIGKVISLTVSKAGIRFTAEVARGLADADHAWSLVKAGLAEHVSIGFRPIKSERMKESTGMRFTQWELLELSIVVVPANPDARIEHVTGKHAAQTQRQRAPIKLITTGRL